MKKNVRRLLSLFTLVCLIVTQTLSASAAAQSSQPRVYGSDRYKTSVAISQKGWSESQYAVIARGDDFADALCAGPLAKKYDAPILLTQPDKISNDVLAELKRLGVKNVFIVGGNGAVSENVENILKSSGIASIERIFGADRYETSVKIAEKLGSVDKMALATGSDFPDALSISAIASSMGMPILLTEKNTLPAKVRSYIVSAGIAESYVIGGTGVISDSVKNALPNAIRLGGKDRYETNVAVMNQFVDKLNFNNIYVAVGDGKNGDGFADALTGAALAAKDSSPLILAYNVLPKVTADFLKSKVFAQSQVYALGGEAVVPSSILNTIASYISQGLKGKILSQAGVYGPQEGTETVDDNVIITVRDVTLQNTIIEGDLIITESVGDGDVTLKNVTVNGTTTIRGGGPNSVVMYNFKGKTVVVDVPDGRSVRLVAQGDTSVESLNMNSDGKLEESELTGNGFTDVVIPEGAQVVLKGSFNTVDIKADNADVSVESGSINSLNISKGVAGAKVDIAKNAKVVTLTANAPVKVSGEGTIHIANIKSDGVELAKEPEKTNIDKGITANIGGKDVDKDDVETPPAGGGGGGSHHEEAELTQAKEAAEAAMDAYLAAGGKDTDAVYAALVEALESDNVEKIKSATAALNQATEELEAGKAELTQAKEAAEAAMDAYLAAGGKDTDPVYAALVEALESNDVKNIKAATDALNQETEKIETARALVEQRKEELKNKTEEASQAAEAVEAAEAQLSLANEAAKSANAALAQAEEDLEAVKSAIGEEAADKIAKYEAAKAAVAKAAEKVETAESQLTQANEAKADADAEASQATEDLEAAEAAIGEEAAEKIEAYEAAKAAVAKAAEKVETAESQLTQANEAKTAAEGAVAEAEEDLEAAESQLASANEAKAAAEGALAQAEEGLESAEAAIGEEAAEKIATYEAAKAAVAEAAEKVETAESQLTEANEAVESAKAALAQAEEGLESAEAAIGEEAAEKIATYEAAKAAVAEAAEKVETAESQLTQANEAVAVAKANAAEKNQAVEVAEAALSEAEEYLRSLIEAE